MLFSRQIPAYFQKQNALAVIWAEAQIGLILWTSGMSPAISAALVEAVAGVLNGPQDKACFSPHISGFSVG
jgi:hypothetical protein